MSELPVAALTSAFPEVLAAQVRAVQQVLRPPELSHAAPFPVRVGGEALLIPYRVYYPVPDADVLRDLTVHQQLVLGCIFTRHHDGLVRQAHLEQVIGSTEPWVVPYVVQLVGEYVLQIILAIRRELTAVGVVGTTQQTVYGQFIADNPTDFRLVRQRVARYWACYYRSRYIRLADYPGETLAAALQLAARHYAAAH
ncbi:hypothetical protein [Verrucosispora sp. WMMD1129]|uniref:hypothetical protein n=1 Tax=Verrucosispora sp. WMMD1129 TaxID=3016093 RepID=UPI00249BCE90|nr:hypothetical protein [Verrucosispora sp. WMMD1129]WFE47691.1 hypothetical protein O7624_26860 [Verrucosispora sp. WMMD1129]